MIYRNCVLDFHKVMSQKWFEEIMLAVKKRYQLITIEDIEKFFYEKKKLEKVCHVTFDDGDKTLYTNAFPIIKKHKIPISVYVSPKVLTERTNYWFQEVDGYEKDTVLKIIKELYPDLHNYEKTSLKRILKSLPIGQIQQVIEKYKECTNTPNKEFQSIDLDQMIEMQDSGLVTFGSHTINHPILPNETDESSEYEIIRSVEWLTELTGRQVEYFAFPNGDCTERDVNNLRKANIKLAFTTKNGTEFSHKGNPLLIPRVGLTFGTPSYLFKKILFGKYWDKIRNSKSIKPLKSLMGRK